MELLVIGWLAFAAMGLLLLNKPRREPYWPKVTQSYITAIFSEDPEAKAKAWEEFHAEMNRN